jgi:hypothetical protein
VARRSLRREAQGKLLAHLYRKSPSLTDAFKELRAQFVEDPERRAAVKAELRALMNGLIGALSPKECVHDPSVPDFKAELMANDRAPDLPDYAGARQYFSSWLEDSRTFPRKSVRAQLATEFQQFVPRLISAYEDPRSFFLRGPPQPILPPDLLDGSSRWFDLATSIREWGLGVLLDPEARRILDEIDGETINRFLAVAESRREFREGRPPGDSENLARMAAQALDESQKYVAEFDRDPGERLDDLTIYSEEERIGRTRAPSATAAAHARAASDIGKSKRTARRYRRKSSP